MIYVTARITAKAGKGMELLAAFNDLLPSVHAEAGCVAYVPTVDLVTDLDRMEPVDPEAVTIMERWENLEHLKAHLIARHMVDFRSRVGDLIDRAELRVLESG